MRRLLSTLLAFVLLNVSFAFAQLSVTSNLTVQFSAAPGAALTGQITLANPDEQAAQARIYQVDYQLSPTGVQYPKVGSHPRSNGLWVGLGAEIVTVPPNSSLEVPFTVTVPQNVPLAGAYWSMIMVEPLAQDDARVAQTAPDARAAFTIRQVVRYGVQVITNFGTNSKRALSFREPSLQRDEQGQLGLSFILSNEGEVALRPALSTEVYNSQGQLVGRVDRDGNRLFPGFASRQQVVLPTLPAGTYQVVVVADGGANAVFGVRYTFDVKP